MMIQIFILTGIVLALRTFINFLFQPYFNWMKNQSKKIKEQITIKDRTGKYTFEEYQKSSPRAIELSIVVPAYNEEKRLPSMLDKTLTLLHTHNITFEIIVVNDFSKDKTTQVALKYSQFNNKSVDLKVVEYEQNKGKGGAVRIGMMVAQGKYILMADADGATEFREYEFLLSQLKQIEKNDLGIVAGSRSHITEKVKRTPLRKLLAFFSSFIINVVCGIPLKDTQCGFKLFTNKTAKLLFKILHLERWAFDVELFILAYKFKIPVGAVPVEWRDVEGSHLDILDASFTMSRDFVLVRILYMLGLWKVNDQYNL